MRKYKQLLEKNLFKISLQSKQKTEDIIEEGCEAKVTFSKVGRYKKGGYATGNDPVWRERN